MIFSTLPTLLTPKKARIKTRVPHTSVRLYFQLTNRNIRNHLYEYTIAKVLPGPTSQLNVNFKYLKYEFTLLFVSFGIVSLVLKTILNRISNKMVKIVNRSHSTYFLSYNQYLLVHFCLVEVYLIQIFSRYFLRYSLQY